MNLKQYITANGRGSAAKLAKDAKINRLYLSQITTGNRKPSPAMAERISKATGFKVSIESLRPDIAEIFREQQGGTNLETPHGTEATPAAGGGDIIETAAVEGGVAAESSASESAQY